MGCVEASDGGREGSLDVVQSASASLSLSAELVLVLELEAALRGRGMTGLSSGRCTATARGKEGAKTVVPFEAARAGLRGGGRGLDLLCMRVTTNSSAREAVVKKELSTPLLARLRM